MSANEGLINLIHREVARVLDRRTRRIPAIVDSWDGNTYSVKVKFQPEGTLSGWIPMETTQASKGNSGHHIAPNINDHGWVEFHEDDREAAIFVAATFNDKFPPFNIAAGEHYYKQPNTGATYYFKNDGSVTVTDKAGNSIVMNGTDTITVTAPNIVLNGSVTLGGAKGSGVPAAKQGTVDTAGNADETNLATKVMVN